jgi:hypothetical protein
MSQWNGPPGPPGQPPQQQFPQYQPTYFAQGQAPPPPQLPPLALPGPLQGVAQPGQGGAQPGQGGAQPGPRPPSDLQFLLPLLPFQAHPTGEPPKRIFVLADGTWKDQLTQDDPPTNVYRFHACLNETDLAGREQIYIYQPGIGNATEGTPPQRAWRSMTGGGLGRGKTAVVLI